MAAHVTWGIGLRASPALESIDCEQHIKGSHPIYIADIKKAKCVCEPLTINGAQNECIDCDRYFSAYKAAAKAKDVNAAQSFINIAINCQWTKAEQAMLNDFKNKEKCQDLEAQMSWAANQVPQINMAQADALYNQARQLNCNISQNTANALNAANNRQKQEDRKKFQQNEERRQQDADRRQQAMANIFSNTVTQIQKIQEEEYRKPPPPRRPDPVKYPPVGTTASHFPPMSEIIYGTVPHPTTRSTGTRSGGSGGMISGICPPNNPKCIKSLDTIWDETGEYFHLWGWKPYSGDPIPIFSEPKCTHGTTVREVKIGQQCGPMPGRCVFSVTLTENGRDRHACFAAY